MPRENTKKKKYDRQGNERARNYSYNPSSTDRFLHNPVTNFWDENWKALPRAWNGRMESERDYYLQSALMTVPGINGMLQANWNKNALQHYMSNYGMTWSDLLSRNVFGGQFSPVSGMRSSVNFVGDMVKELYS